MKRTARTLLGTAIGLSLMQLVLSTSQNGGKSGSLLSAAFQYPAAWLRDLADPSKPGIPEAKKSTAQQSSATTSSPGVVGGLSGTGTPAGTGSNLLSV